LSPDGDDPIFIGMNRLIAKGLNPEPEYPCRVANRFRCPYVERCDGKDARFDIGDLYRLGELSFAVEVSLAKARRNDSVIKIRNKEDLLHALTDKEIFHKILEQGTEGHEVGEWAKACLRENMAYILNYFVKIKDKIIPEELRLF
jgi:hypothetical protein